jgi:hypothetical protein
MIQASRPYYKLNLLLGETFVKATYDLEGDVPLAFECFRVAAAIHAHHYPNVQAISRKLSPGKSATLGFLCHGLCK